jgi:hypothetical protein
MAIDFVLKKIRNKAIIIIIIIIKIIAYVR